MRLPHRLGHYRPAPPVEPPPSQPAALETQAGSLDRNPCRPPPLPPFLRPGLATATGANIKDLIALEALRRQRRDTDAGTVTDLENTMTDRGSPERPGDSKPGSMEHHDESKPGSMERQGTLDRTGKSKGSELSDTSM